MTEVNSIGGYAKEYQVAPDTERLASYGLSLTDIITALERNNANVGAGYIERKGEQYLIRAPGQVKSMNDIKDIVLTAVNGQAIKIRDVAEVAIGKELRTGAATDNGKEVVLGTVFMLIGKTAVLCLKRSHKSLSKLTRLCQRAWRRSQSMTAPTLWTKRSRR